MPPIGRRTACAGSSVARSARKWVSRSNPLNRRMASGCTGSPARAGLTLTRFLQRRAQSRRFLLYPEELSHFASRLGRAVVGQHRPHVRPEAKLSDIGPGTRQRRARARRAASLWFHERYPTAPKVVGSVFFKGD